MKAILFDLDETILDRQGSLIDFVRWQASEKLVLQIQAVEVFIHRFIELDANGSVWKDIVYQQLIVEFELTQFTMPEMLQSYELSFCNFCKPNSGAEEAINKLKNMGLKIGLISNGKSPFQERNFEALGLSDDFDVVVVSEKVGYRKPDAAIFNLACEQLNVQPTECAFVGDNPIADIEGANRVGMYSIFYSKDKSITSNLASTNCHDFYDLPAIIKALMR